MQSIPELEIKVAAQDRPKSKWKRPVFWCVVVVLVFVNLYFLAITWLPRWAPEFTRKHVRHPTAVARAVACQLENGTFEPAWVSSGGTIYFESGAFHALCFEQTEIFGGAHFSSWSQGCLRDVFLKGNKWEKLAVLYIAVEFSCPDCLDAISAAIPKLDLDAKKLVSGALAKMEIPEVIPASKSLLSDAAPEVRFNAVTALEKLAFTFKNTDYRGEVLDLFRRAMNEEKTPFLQEHAAYHFVRLLCYDLDYLSSVRPDEELLAIFQSSFESVIWWLARWMAEEQCNGRLDASWVPRLNEIYTLSTSANIRGNLAVVLILAGAPSSEEKLREVERTLHYGNPPLSVEKLREKLSDDSDEEVSFIWRGSRQSIVQSSRPRR